MTPEEQQQVQAARNNFYERQCGNMATEGANFAALSEILAIKLKAAEARIKELEPKPEPKLSVVPEPGTT